MKKTNTLRSALTRLREELNMTTVKDTSARTGVAPFYALTLTVMMSLFSSGSLSSQSSEYTWEFFTELKHGRQQHRSTWIGTDRVLVTGGKINGVGHLIGDPTTSCEIIDISSASSFEVAPMNIPRAEHAILTDPRDSTVIVICGVIEAADGSTSAEITNSIERYDPKTDTWEIIGYGLFGRRQHTAYWLNDNEIVIVGGRRVDLSSMDEAEVFNTTTKESRQVASFPQPINTAVSIVAGTFDGVVIGGRSGGPGSSRTPLGYRYNPLSDEWNLMIDIGVEVARPTSIGLWDGGAIVSGGARDESPYNSVENVWFAEGINSVKTIGMMQNGRQWHGAGQVNTDSVIVGSGFDDGPMIRPTCDWVNVTTSTVTPGPSLNVGRGFTNFVAVPSHFDSRGIPTTANVLCIGGIRQDDTLEPRVEILVRDCVGEQNLLASSVLKQFRGSAVEFDDGIQLTTSTTFQAGSAWIQKQVQVSPSLDVSFSFSLSDGSDNDLEDGSAEGADGVCLVIQDNYPSALGEPGEGIGYDDITHAVAIEFDSYMNASLSDPNGSHVAVQVGDGQKTRAAHNDKYMRAMATDGVPEFVADGSRYFARVYITGASLQVWISNSPDLGEPVINIPFDIREELGLAGDGRAWVGITAATGFSQEEHFIHSWSLGSCDAVISSVDDEEQASSETGSMVRPNPAATTATLVLGEKFTGTARYRIVDATGVTLFEATATQQSVDLPVASLPSGAYMIVIENEASIESLMWNVIR